MQNRDAKRKNVQRGFTPLEIKNELFFSVQQSRKGGFAGHTVLYPVSPYE